MNGLPILRDDCMDEGLDCGTCVEVAACNLAAVCRDLKGKALEHVFLQLYSRRGCRRMFRAYEAAYHAHVEASLIEIAAPSDVPRRAVQPAPVRRIAQCA